MDFDKFSQDYEQIHNKSIKMFGEKSEYFYKYKIKILDNFFLEQKIEKKIKLLDLGCGIGKLERYLYTSFPFANVCGIDSSSESIKVASSANKKTTFLVYNGEEIPFKDNSFNAIILAGVLHHIPPTKREIVLKESFRVLKKSGYLFIFEHNPFNLLARYIVKTCIFDVDANLLTKRNCVNILKNSGFFVVEMKYIVFFPKILKYFRKFESRLVKCPLGAQYFIVAKKE